ncbi:MAG TPA: cyclase family protein [Anaerolineaceae bacterium]|nr:cyclase family protein [Anaerolineaceae bacterium]
MTKIYDITLTVTPDLPVWPGDPRVSLERFNKMEDGAVCNISRMALGVHTGTHMDAPFHFVHGAETIETLPLERLIGQALVVALPQSCVAITAEALQQAGIPKDCRRILFKTRNSRFWSEKPLAFHTVFTAVTPDGAHWLVKQGIEFVGVDYLSVAPFNQGAPTHQVLLQAGVVILEGVNLSEVAAGWYQLICLPMKLGGSDGAPARAVLIQD